MNLLLLSLNAGALPGFLLRHTGRAPSALRIGFIDDAHLPYVDQPYTSFEWTQLTDLGFRLTRMTVGKYTDAADFESDLRGVDAVYLCGGHTFVLLGALQRSGAGEVLKARVRAGLPYIGLSAGAVVAGPTVEPVAPLDDPAEAPGVTDFTGLGLADTVVIPHADGRLPPYPSSMIDEIVRTYGGRFPLTRVNDDQALLVEDGVATIVSSPIT
ncbi:Type 1 glutamine amidotransferase-like domain-containing protein [Tsukamurella sp. 1534]|uniref:Type 1 glutamine amidotransferase-like domain-containing protein n=1 Tax=Tsukamurella sp. 1534 TaxID=1151061 RepID=UPI0002DACBAD|nr:Type 1 glutamine amidotransferase-like domain-containing protein [Tsukamurella sp. 1534]